ncbi:hypothetical protein [Ulvibacterium sp.]|uniref:hypothetical protein n=1 Tax=Ulvibacterium sp. TaxID=2665914 RepID=UPI00262D349E|nr:hypothetical protein [Ulvibacterium sp.]
MLSLLFSIGVAYDGYRNKKRFTKSADTLRHWTATIAHIQLIVGFILYFKSPIISFFYSNYELVSESWNTIFFAVVHFAIMLIGIVILTIASAMAKRKPSDELKFKTMLVWYSVSLILIVIAIPWPFSPLSERPLIRY